MNQGSQSIANCPGRYSLQIAEFSGRSTFNDKDERFQGILNLKKSPLATAADDAEHLADRLAKDPDIQKLGQPIYVYHDRTPAGSSSARSTPARPRRRRRSATPCSSWPSRFWTASGPTVAGTDRQDDRPGGNA